MSNLKILDLYNSTSDNKIDDFTKKSNSSLSVKVDYNKTECNYEWLDIMEDTIKYIDNILRNPNRFIVNEEDVIKVELARRVTVESIKHLSKNTNLIQDIDKKTGDVRPSKILNINKEESYDTYENRLIYSLIQNMKAYIARKKKSIDTSTSLKNNKNLEYRGSTEIGREKVNINMMLETKLKEDGNKSNEELLERIDKLEQQIGVLTGSDVYKTIEKKRIALVTSPIKKTNLIMKNVNFQYATKLWDYMQDHYEDDIKVDKKEETIKDDAKTKGYIDEIFLVSYLALDAINNNEPLEVKEEISERLASSMVEKMMDLNTNLTEEQLQAMVAEQFSKIKYRNVASEKEIQNKFKNSIDKYLDKIKNIKI